MQTASTVLVEFSMRADPCDPRPATPTSFVRRVVWHPASRLLATALLCLSQAECSAHRMTLRPVLTELGRQNGLTRHLVRTSRFAGLSDLTMSADGGLWSVPERAPFLVPLTLTDTSSEMRGPEVPILGLPGGLDVESVVALRDGRFAIGTESNTTGRTSDLIFILQLADDGAHVVETIEFPYALWRLIALGNEGIEGLCETERGLLATSETTGRLPGGQRYAPVAEYDRERAHWTPYRLLLTTSVGKISALTHAQGTNPSVYYAIERDYDVARLLRFVLPASSETPIQAEMVLDLAPLVDPLPNYEGLVVTSDGDAVLITDNQMAFVTGPTEALFVPSTVLVH